MSSSSHPVLLNAKLYWTIPPPFHHPPITAPRDSFRKAFLVQTSDSVSTALLEGSSEGTYKFSLFSRFSLFPSLFPQAIEPPAAPIQPPRGHPDTDVVHNEFSRGKKTDSEPFYRFQQTASSISKIRVFCILLEIEKRVVT